MQEIVPRLYYSYQSYQLGTLSTVYQCELFALHMASVWAANNIGNPSDITFLSDSQAAIKAINSFQVKSRQVLDIIQQLNNLGSKHRVDVRWVPGHEGVHGNETADELARAGHSPLAYFQHRAQNRRTGDITTLSL